MEISTILEKQRQYFLSGETLDYKFRINQLNKLLDSINTNSTELLAAFKADLNKCEYDAVSTEIGLVIKEIKYLRSHLRGLMRPHRATTSIINFPSSGKIVREPFGQVLIMSPWNYPFQLAICPLAGAIAGGNTAVVKPSAYTPTVSAVIAKILAVFAPEYIACVQGGREQNQELLNQKFDFIFFTGSKAVGEIVEEKASKHLCPVVLELGGKSPCIVDETANIKKAAKRIVWGKFLNAGQTCIAPDYILVQDSIYDKFIAEVIAVTKEFYYDGDKLKDDFMYIVNEKHANRLKNLIIPEKVVFGGKLNNRLLEPTIMKNVSYDDAVMQEEIFGPIMPIIKYSDISEVIDYINSHDKPLALYYFTKNKKLANLVISRTSSGGVCLNEVVMHFTEHNLPFGGVGASGMGNYHGKHSFFTFTHAKCVLKKSANLELNLKYPPCTTQKTKITYMYLGYKKPKNKQEKDQ